MFDIPISVYLLAFFSLSGWMFDYAYRSIPKEMITPVFLKKLNLHMYGTAAVLLILMIIAFRQGGFHYLSAPLVTLAYIKIKVLHIQTLNGIDLFSKDSVFWISAFAYPICSMVAIDVTSQFFIIGSALKRLKPENSEESLDEFIQILEPLLKTKEVRCLSEFRHHRYNTRLDHSLEVAWHSYVAAKRLSLDFVAAARGGLLHDLFFYDWLTEGTISHGHRHPQISLQNALKITELSILEIDMIKKHMWPLTLNPPRYIESWIVCFADTYCGIKDCVSLLKGARTRSIR